MTTEQDFVDRLAKSLTKADKAEAVKDLAAMIVALMRRVERLEARTVPKYCGTWHANGIFAEGTMITHDGSLWFAKTSTDGKPGASAAWQLCVKRGRDGKDLR